MSSQLSPKLTPQEYLAKERAAEFKSEFYRGEMFAMAGASRRHNLIALNVAAEVRQALKLRPCEVYPSDMRVRVEETGLYTYPDVVVVCGEPEFEDDEVDTLLNPTLLVEVLSKSTEGYDRGAKARQYRTLPSLQEHVLISQDRIDIESMVRQSGDEWLFRQTTTLATVTFASLDITIDVAEIYRNVDFGLGDADTSGGSR